MQDQKSEPSNSPPQEFVGGRYRIDSVLGRGGMGTVYRANDLLGGSVALKRLHLSVEEFSRDITRTAGQTSTAAGKAAVSLAHEFRTLSSLRHPNVISVLDYGFDAEHRPYLTMELLDQAQTFVAAAKDKSYAVRLQLLAQVLQALVYLHRRGVIHRDLKPANILVVDEQVKVLDFGISLAHEEWKNQELASNAGTPGYVAPELFRGESPSEASDLYSFGLMAAQILSAKPVTERTPQVLLAAIEEPSVARVLARLLEPEPRARYASAEDVIVALREATGQALESETVATRESFLQAARYVGRETERKRLEHALDEALEGRGGAWLIGGESGIGKSRLCERIRAHAQVKGALVLRGQSVSTGSAPFQVWRNVLHWMPLLTTLDDLEAGVLKALVPDIEKLIGREVPDPPPINADMASLRLFDTIEALLSRLEQPVMVLLEDLHWEASDSLALLARVVKRVSGLRMLILANYRSEERPELPREVPGMEVLLLSRLNPREIEQLSESMIGTAGRAPQVLELLRRETEGNPFFLVEVVRALAEEAGQLERIGTMQLPEQVFAGGVRQIIQRRLDRVPLWARELLRLAAVLGRHVEPEVLRAAAPEVELSRWLADCASAAVLDFADERWRFAHDKLREQLLAGLSPELQPALHRQAARAIEAAHPHAPEWLAALAHHWGEAKDAEREAHYSKKAGEQAMSVYACHAALPYLQRAVALASAKPGGTTHVGHLQGLLAEAYYLIGDLQACLTQGEQALEHLGWPLPKSPAGWRLGLPYQLLARLFQAAAPHAFEEESDERRQVRVEASRMLIRLCEVFFYLQDADRLRWSGVRLMNVLEPAGPSSELARGYITLATVMNSIPALRSVTEAWCDRALEMAERSGNTSNIVYILVRCGVCGIGYARWKDVESWVERARQLSEATRDFRQLEESYVTLSSSTLYQGDFHRSIRFAKELEASARRRGAMQTQYWGPLIRSGSMVRLGRTEEVVRELEAALPWFETYAGASETVNIYGGLALALLRRGQEERALQMAAKGLALLRNMTPVAYWLSAGAVQVAEVYLTLWELRGEGTPPGGEELVQAAKDACKALRLFGRAFVFGEPFALLFDGLEAWLSGRHAAAVRTWRRCAVRAAELEMPYEEGRAWLELGRHLSPQEPQRRELLLRAKALFSRLEAADDLARTEAELARNAPA